MANTVAVIQARQGSSRLPGKTLTSLWGKQTTLEMMIERLRPSKTLDKIVVATTDLPADDAIDSVCKILQIDCFRGSSADVLSRYFQTAQEHKADHVVRLTADCPFQDYLVVDALVETFLNASVDYAANALIPTYPDGFDAEIMSIKALTTAFQNATLKSDREHVTPYIHRHPEQFKILNLPYHRDVSHLRLTLDEPSDLQVMRAMADALFKSGHYVHLEEMLAYAVSHPELIEINGSIPRNEDHLTPRYPKK